MRDLLEANGMSGEELLRPGDRIRLPGRVHQVERGDTLWGISKRYRVALEELLEANGMTGSEVLRPGRILKVPG